MFLAVKERLQRREVDFAWHPGTKSELLIYFKTKGHVDLLQDSSQETFVRLGLWKRAISSQIFHYRSGKDVSLMLRPDA